jgi:dGTPase
VDEVRAIGSALAGFSEEMATDEAVLKRFMYAKLYHHPLQLGAAEAARHVVAGLFDAYHSDAQKLPEEWRTTLPQEAPARARHIADFIAGMTDRYAIARYKECFGDVDLPEGF